MARRKNPLKQKKRKRVTVELAPRENAGKVTAPYRIMEGLIRTDRADLKGVKIAILFANNWRQDADGILRLGTAKPIGSSDRELAEYDCKITLNRAAFDVFKDEQRERLIYHELEHLQVCVDKNGEAVRDDKGRLVFRCRKHDVEEHSAVIKKYGLGDSLSELAKSLIADAQRPLLQEAK